MFDYESQQKKLVARKLLRLIQTGKIPDSWPALAKELGEPGLPESTIRIIVDEFIAGMPKGSVQFR
jgi:hypothetical protein